MELATVPGASASASRAYFVESEFLPPPLSSSTTIALDVASPIKRIVAEAGSGTVAGEENTEELIKVNILLEQDVKHRRESDKARPGHPAGAGAGEEMDTEVFLKSNPLCAAFIDEWDHTNKTVKRAIVFLLLSSLVMFVYYSVNPRVQYMPMQMHPAIARRPPSSSPELDVYLSERRMKLRRDRIRVDRDKTRKWTTKSNPERKNRGRSPPDEKADADMEERGSSTTKGENKDADEETSRGPQGVGGALDKQIAKLALELKRNRTWDPSKQSPTATTPTKEEMSSTRVPPRSRGKQGQGKPATHTSPSSKKFPSPSSSSSPNSSSSSSSSSSPGIPSYPLFTDFAAMEGIDQLCPQLHIKSEIALAQERLTKNYVYVPVSSPSLGLKQTFPLYVYNTNDVLSKEVIESKQPYCPLTLLSAIKSCVDMKQEDDQQCLFLDVGGNIGSCSVAAARLGAHVLAFEVAADNLALLEHNILSNQVEDKVRVCRFGLSDKTAMNAPLFLLNGNSGHNMVGAMQDRLKDQYRESSCALRKADDVVKNTLVDVLKVDVEGSEFNVLKGMSRLAKARSLGLVHAEFAPSLYDKDGTNPFMSKKFLHFVDRYLHMHVFYDREKEIQAHAASEGVGAFAKVRVDWNYSLIPPQDFEKVSRFSNTERYHQFNVWFVPKAALANAKARQRIPLNIHFPNKE